MGTPHKWKKEMIAFANGAEIQQCLDEFGCVWVDVYHPNFNCEQAKFRVTPQTEIKKEKSMGTPHKHAAVIKAWADGAEVQYKLGDEWKLLESKHPGWLNDNEYRIKPQTIKYRVALMKGKDYCHTLTADDFQDENQIESIHNFSHWLTDWVEVEV